MRVDHALANQPFNLSGSAYMKKLRVCALIVSLCIFPVLAQDPCSLGGWGEVRVIETVGHCGSFHVGVFDCGGPFGDDVVGYYDYYYIAPPCGNR
jgi:hypothetical protein